jgi:hypothetical protein
MPQWKWSIKGSMPAHPTDRDLVDSGIVECELAGEALLSLAHSGPFWDVLATDRPFTLTIAPQETKGKG